MPLRAGDLSGRFSPVGGFRQAKPEGANTPQGAPAAFLVWALSHSFCSFRIPLETRVR